MGFFKKRRSGDRKRKEDPTAERTVKGEKPEITGKHVRLVPSFGSTQDLPTTKKQAFNQPVVSLGAKYSIDDTIKGQWKIIGVCGGKSVSGMGIVYIVEDLSRQCILAAKTFQPELTSAPGIREELKKEAKLWMDLGRHPNIVNVEFIDDSVGGQIFIFLEYIGMDDERRNSLTDFLKNRPLPDQYVSRWAMEFCCGMVHANKRGLQCHRDLKPDNLMITPDKQLKITDYGLAKVFSRDLSPEEDRVGLVDCRNQQINLDNIQGTPGYLAPEVVHQPNSASVKSDIYAFGLILHQMISGKPEPPLIGNRNQNICDFERENIEIRQKKRPPALNSVYDRIIYKCLEYLPEHRYASFSEIAEELSRLSPTRATFYRAMVDINDQSNQSESLDEDLVDKAISRYRLGELTEALECIRRAKKKYGETSSIMNTEGVILSDLKHYEEALSCFDKSIAFDPDWVYSWSNKGRTLRAMGLYSDALECYNKAIEYDPEHCPPWTNKANCLCDLHEYEKAIYHYDEALCIDKNYLDAWTGRARALKQLERYEESLECIENALKLNPSGKAIQKLRIQVKKAIQKHQEGSKFTQLEEQVNPIKSGAYLETNHDSLTYSQMINRFEQLYHSKKLSEAYRCIKVIKAKYGTNEVVWNLEGVIHSDLGKYEEALVCLDKSIEIDPKWVNSWSNKGRTLRAMGRPHDALQCYDRAIECDCGQTIPWLNKGNCLLGIGRQEEAAECYEKAFLIDPDDTLVRKTCGNLLDDWRALNEAECELSDGNYGEAIKKANLVAMDSMCYKKAKDIQSKIYYDWGLSLAKEKKTAEAITCLLKTLEVNADGEGQQLIQWLIENLAQNDE